jgi:sugar phosphate isomerase/epimerase
MQAGVSTASLFLRKSNEESLELFNRLGVKTAEVFLTTFSEYGQPFADFLSSKKGKVFINSVHILNTQFEPQLFAAHPLVKSDAYAWLDKVLTSANALGAPYYTFHGTARVKSASRSGKNDNFPTMIKGFEELTEFCEKRGVTLCLENVEWATYNRPGVFSKIADQIPSIRGVLDIKQARLSEHPYEIYLEEMGEKIAYVHLSDLDEFGKLCLPGKGRFDFDTLLKRLRDVGFDGALLIEVYQNDYQEIAELKESLQFLREKVEKYAGR